MVQESHVGKYWFKQEDLLEPIDWEYVKTLPDKVRDALELYMRGEVSIGKACQIANLSLREFDDLRSKARIPVHI